MSYPVARFQIRWLTPEEGGRKCGPPPGHLFVTTARFAEDPEERQFSVALHRLDKDANTNQWLEVELSPLFPDSLPDVVKRLVPESRLLIHEGRKVVAEGKVLSVRVIEGKSVLSYKEIESLRPPITSANN
jgi:hypothetical protein